MPTKRAKRARPLRRGWDAIPPNDRPVVAAKMRDNAAAVARWLRVDLPRRQLARYEAVCQGILSVPTDPRRAIAERMLVLIAVARSNLERGHQAAEQRVAIERLARKGNELVLQAALAAEQQARRAPGVQAAAARKREAADQARALFAAAEVAQFRSRHPRAQISAVIAHIKRKAGPMVDVSDWTLRRWIGRYLS